MDRNAIGRLIQVRQEPLVKGLKADLAYPLAMLYKAFLNHLMKYKSSMHFNPTLSVMSTKSAAI